MKKIIWNPQLFADHMGLSCVENLFLYLLKSEGVEYESLFWESFLPYHVIEQAFTANKCSYASFSLIRRIQDLAEDEGMAKLYRVNDDSIPEGDENQYLLMMVTPEFSQQKYNKPLWRNDHYIIVSRQDSEKYLYLNDNPRDSGVLTAEELKRYYGGKAILVDLVTSQFMHSPQIYVDRLIDRLSLVSSEQSWSGDIYVLRDILGVLRILRRRLTVLVSKIYDIGFMREYLNKLDRNYAILEYMRLRQNYDVYKLQKIREDVLTCDKQAIQRILSLYGRQ